MHTIAHTPNRRPAGLAFVSPHAVRFVSSHPSHVNSSGFRRWWGSILLVGSLLTAALPLRATTYTLGGSTPSSPISVSFDNATGRMSVTVKSTGTVWGQGTAGGGSTWASPSGWTQPDDLDASGSAAINGYTVTVGLQIVTATGELKVTLGSNTVNIANGIVYPYPFFKSDGSGYAVLPYMGGFVVPTTATGWIQPSSQSRMEWVGGTDSSWNEGWMAIANPAADMLLVKQNATVASNLRLGGAFQWLGSNANSSLTPNLLSYSRVATFTFYTSGGYVALAKHFRDFAMSQGWVVSLATKSAANSDVNKLLGAPVIYLWGDGRSDTMLTALANAGIEKALIQISINHVDQNNYFPNQAYADGSGWSAAVRSHGWVPGIYDIYAAYNTGQSAPPYNGFLYDWATGGAGSSSSSTTWAYLTASSTWDISGTQAIIAQGKASIFARDTRLPAHISQFGLDAFFFDTTCANPLEEDYASAYGHTASRAQDIANRAALLAAASGASAPNHNKLAGTEQAKSWAVPYIDWTEGMFKLGVSNAPQNYGTFNNPVYPQILTDVTDPGSNLPSVLNTGYQVPLWELVYHDSLLSVQHWHLAHNKLLYCWDFADLNAMIRGQAPILHLAYNADVGTVGRTIGGATDADTGLYWDIKWTNSNVPTRVMQTYNSVCTWQGIVGDLPMTNHQILSADSSNNYLVQNSEFSGDGGTSGYGIVVNFGSYPGTGHVMTGSTWNGTIRGNALTVPVNSYATYTWGMGDTIPPTVSITAPTNGATVSGTITVSASASDNVGVVGVQFKLDGANLGTEVTSAPYNLSWDTTSTSNGSHTLTAVARDAAGNSTTSSAVNVTVSHPTTVTLESVAAEDGWVLESAHGSGVGGSNNSTNTTLWIGDDTSKRQYKAVVSFDTSSIPSTATILSVTLQLTRSTVTGTDPFSWSGNVCYVDVSTGGFNGNTSLENADFQASATAAQVATMSDPPTNNSTSTGSLNSTGIAAINRSGRTQFRVYFSQETNNNTSNDYLQLYSSNYTTDTSRRPKLIVVYQ